MHRSTNAKIPHYELEHAPVHLTYRLKGSIPTDHLIRLAQKREEALAQLKNTATNSQAPPSREQLETGVYELNRRYELAVDRFLHTKANGPYHLANEEIANHVLNSWKWLHHRNEIMLSSVCIMSNHVHVVLGNPTPLKPLRLGPIVGRSKSFTAHQANRLLGRAGRAFWEDYYFDVTVRRENLCG